MYLIFNFFADQAFHTLKLKGSSSILIYLPRNFTGDMHFAFPPRKSSHPPPYAIRPARSKYSRRRHQLQVLGLTLLAILGAIYLLYRLFYRWDVRAAVPTIVKAPPGTPSVVIVTVLDDDTSDALREIIFENRRAYTTKHGENNLLSCSFKSSDK